MKDWLASLIRTKRNLSASLKQSGDGDFEKVASVVSAFKPFLATLGLATGEFPADLVADALFRYLSDKANSVENADVLSTLKAEECGTQKTKSGRLDKLSDDVLGVVLPFLGIRDRCLGVERVCRRLFETSRKFPIHCERKPKRIPSNFQKDSRLRIATRLCPRTLGHNMLANTSVAEVKRYAASIESLGFWCEEKFDAVFGFHFPKLQRVSAILDCADDNRVPKLGTFLSRHPTVTHFEFCPFAWTNDEAEIIGVIARNRNLRSFTLKLYGVLRTQQITVPLDFDLSHVTALDLGNNLLPRFQPLFHESLESLTLYRCRAPFPARLKMPKLKRLRIDGMPFSDLRDFLHALSVEKLNVCWLECDVSELAEILISCPPTKCLICRVDIDEENTDMEQVIECLTEALNSGLIQVELLRPVFKQSLSCKALREWFLQNAAQLSVRL